MQQKLGRVTRLASTAVAALAVGVVPAHALAVRATLSGGAISVNGTQAAKSATISWEGAVVTTANKGGSFAFTTTVVPTDCIGTLNDGTSTVEVRIDGCSTVTTGLPGTGQLISYAAGDDGNVRAGGALSYTDNGDATVTDNRTGLVWEKKTDANVNAQYTWQEAFDYVAALNAMNGGGGFAGHNDWRLPNAKELQSILDYGRVQPMIDPIFGPTIGVREEHVYYWTSTSYAAAFPEFVAWGFDFDDGDAIPFNKGGYLAVRAVRGGF